MTVSTTTARNVKTGNDVTTSFPFDFAFEADGDLVVNRVVITSGVETLQTLTTDYTVTGGSGATGTIEMVSAPPATDNLVIERNLAYTQGTDYQPNDPFPAEVNETALDRLTFLVQQVLELTKRVIKLPLNTTLSGVTFPVPVALKLFRWNATATDLEQTDDPAVSAAAAAVSETNAATSETNAATSETNAATSASAASTSETNAATSETNAATSETNAATSAATIQQFNVKDPLYGAVGDGVADDRVAINAADADAATDGGIVFYPPGTYLVGKNEEVTGTDGGACIKISSSVLHVGSGVAATTVKIKGSADASAFVLRNTVDSGVLNMEVDGNRANQTKGECIRVTGTATRMILRDLYTHDSHAYGIGIQVDTAKDCDVGHIVVENSGRDGIDMKNESDDSSGNRLHDITIRTINLLVGAPVRQAGINPRAGWILNNIYVFGLADDEVGIRFNAGEVATSGGVSRRSSLTNFYIEGAGSTTVGIQADARETNISNGIIIGTSVGLMVRQREQNFSNIFIDSPSADGIQLIDGSFSTPPERNTFTNIVVRNATDACVSLDAVADLNHFVNLVGRVCDRGIVIASGAASNTFIGGGMTSITTTVVADSGTDNIFRNVGGIENEITKLSSTFLIDSAATVTVVFAHNLPFTPNKADVQVSISEASVVDDWVIDHLKVVSTDATNITFDVVIGTGSATGSATARLTITAGFAHVRD